MPSAFLERDAPPDERSLTRVLGRASATWQRLRADLVAAGGPLEEKWSFSGKSHGWILKVSRKKRTIVYLIPCAGHFVASFALNARACAAAREAELPAALRAAIARAPAYAEGRGVRLEVRARKDLAPVEALAALAGSA